jgi:tetratricopeptide (TPR) repeat protein
MDREHYLGLIRKGSELAFERGDLAAAANHYAEALNDLGPSEWAHSDHYGEYAAVLRKLGRKEEAAAQARFALQAALQESAGDPDSIVVAIHRYFLGEHLVDMGRYDEALEAIAPSLETRTNTAPLLLMVQAEALVALGRLAEAEAAAAAATNRASTNQRAGIAARLSRVLGDR